jgi:hypothetical protein
MLRLAGLLVCLGLGLGFVQMPDKHRSGRELSDAESSQITGGACGQPHSVVCGTTAACTGSTCFGTGGEVNCNLTGLGQGCSSACSVYSGQNCACNG